MWSHRVCLVLAALVSFVSAVHQKTLVLIDDLSIQNTHSKFLQSLTGRGYELTVRMADSDDIELKKYGEFLYDNLIMLCPTAEDFGGDLSEELILEFVDAGNSLIIAGSTNVKSAIRDLASECGVEFDAAGTVVMDHGNYDASDPDGTHTLIVADSTSGPILGDAQVAPVLYHGIGCTVSDSNTLANKLLAGGPTTYSANPLEAVGRFTAGRDTALVTAVQTLGQGRVLVSGSLELFSNRFFDASVSRVVVGADPVNAGASGNAKFVEEATKWTLRERGVLRAHSVFHQKADGSELFPRTYRVKDEVIFSVVIEEFEGATDSWKPYTAEDVQVEFHMLDPYLRQFLKPQGDGTFTLQTILPDVYGVFKFTIDYRRTGYSYVVVQQEVGVRPFRHNEFERFIVSAYPYYVSSFSMMGGFVVFSILFLFSKDKTN